MTDEIITSLVSGFILSGVGALCGILWAKLKQARLEARAHENRQERVLDALSNGVRELLMCKLESLRHTMVHDQQGIADDEFKAQSQRIYDCYHALGGNGHGTAINDDIQHAPIAPKTRKEIMP